jgi:general nucleoside transport system permease protein
MSIQVEAPRKQRLPVVPPPLLAGVGIALGLLALWLTLPPLTWRIAEPSVALGCAGATCGALALRRGERRFGGIAIACAVLGCAGSVGVVQIPVDDLDVIVWSALISSMFVNATPLVFGALGGMIAERSGVINIGLEGMMLAGAFFGIWAADFTGSWVAGLLLAMVSGALLGLLHAIFAVHLRANQIVAGVGINFLALGVTGYLFIDAYGARGTPSGISSIPDVQLPGLPDGSFFDKAVGDLNLMVWIGLALVLVVHWALFYTRIGLRTRAASEHPAAAETAGISVFRVRSAAVVVSGVFAALGGAALSMGIVGSFNQNMTAGRGFIALAAMIFGAWRPFGALAAALLFGFASALALRLPSDEASSAALFQALPYVLTLVAVAGVMGRVTPPASVGKPYRRPTL